MKNSQFLLIISIFALSIFSLNACTIHYVDDNGYHKGHYKVKKNKHYRYYDDDDDDDDDHRRISRIDFDDLDFDIDPEFKIKIDDD